LAGFSEIAAIVKKINNHDALELAIIENIQDLMDHTFRMTRDFGRENKSSFETILELDN
jgi:hypothetical protein